uniref:G-protein coupled receptors family 1 profile domain-containing protein n=1 Tax=Megaselia scalaris TaxID=36166 RepID=T1GP67_MEGSC
MKSDVCCFNRQTFAILLGILELFISSVLLVPNVYCVIFPETLTNRMLATFFPTSKSASSQLYDVVSYFVTASLVLNITSVLCASILIVGTFKRNSISILIWLFNSGLKCFIGFIGCVFITLLLILILTSEFGNETLFRTTLILIVLSPLVTGLYVYLWISILKLHQTIRNDRYFFKTRL